MIGPEPQVTGHLSTQRNDLWDNDFEESTEGQVAAFCRDTIRGVSSRRVTSHRSGTVGRTPCVKVYYPEIVRWPGIDTLRHLRRVAPP